MVWDVNESVLGESRWLWHLRRLTRARKSIRRLKLEWYTWRIINLKKILKLFGIYSEFFVEENLF